MVTSRTLTYDLAYPLEITRLCAGRCGFCPYPFTAHSPIPSFRELRRQVRQAQLLGARMIDLTGGENAEEFVEVQNTLRYYHLHSFLGYIIAASDLCQYPQKGSPVMPRLDIGPLSDDAWPELQPHFCAVRLLLTTVDRNVLRDGALADCPTQDPEVRLQSLIEAARADIPIHTGTMIGIGESRESREKALKVLARFAAKYGHVRTVLLQAFRPHRATPMAKHPPTSLRDLLDAIRMAKEILPPYVAVQVNALDWRDHLPELADAGAEDLGDLNLRVLSQGGRDVEMELSLLFEPLRALGHKVVLREQSPPPRPALNLSQPAIPGNG